MFGLMMPKSLRMFCTFLMAKALFLVRNLYISLK